LRERLAADLANGDREAAVRAFVGAVSGPARWQQLSTDQKSILLDNAATAVRVEGRPLLSCEAIREFRFPILRLVGERSPKRYGEMLRAMGACLSESVGKPIVISNASHGMNRENPQAFNGTILGFLSGR
jgi:pimeloyl-ACP methyl ester carboxylesterase